LVYFQFHAVADDDTDATHVASVADVGVPVGINARNALRTLLAVASAQTYSFIWLSQSQSAFNYTAPGSSTHTLVNTLLRLSLVSVTSSRRAYMYIATLDRRSVHRTAE